MTLTLYRLTTGEDLVATKEKSDVEFTTLKKPFVLIPMRASDGKGMTLGFQPYLPYTRDESITIKTANIIAEATPAPEIEDAYKKNTSSIIQQSKPSILGA